ncbi:MAG: membrane dipeptidase, partial [Alphaproteobacteria bacterium]|nr:membrane dipeptidase [Alphaproteobacteria bacterium]
MLISRRTVLASGAATLAMNSAVLSAAGAERDWRSLHARLVCLDTHLDAPANFPRPYWDIMERHSFETDLSQVDYPRMVEGGLKGGFFVIYTPQGALTDEGYRGARDYALLRAAQIREMVARNHQYFELATVPGDAVRIAAAGKRVVFQSIENSWPLGTDVTLLQSFHKLGVRMAGPVHFTNNQFADSATDPKGKIWNGFSPLGRQWIREANDLGIVLDQSHSSDDVFDQMLEFSRAPIMLSHSGCRAVHDHPRNIDDGRLKRLARAGGTIQINSLSAYLVTTPQIPALEEAQGALFRRLRGLDAMGPREARDTVADVAAQLAGLRRQYPQPRATFDDYARHLTHALDLVGPEHVG